MIPGGPAGSPEKKLTTEKPAATLMPEKKYKAPLEYTEIASAQLTSLGRTFNLVLSIRATLADGKRAFITNSGDSTMTIPCGTVVTSYGQGKFGHASPTEGVPKEFEFKTVSEMVYSNGKLQMLDGVAKKGDTG